MSLTIDEAIARFEANAEQNERWASGGLNPEANAEYAAEHRQLAEWLRELRECRKADTCEGCNHNNGKDYICLICKRHHGDKYVPERRTE